MIDRSNTIVPMAAALAALSGTLPAMDANAATSPQAAGGHPTGDAQPGQPNKFDATGQNLLAFTINEQADGTIVAQHVSHASHASHHSHYSSR